MFYCFLCSYSIFMFNIVYMLLYIFQLHVRWPHFWSFCSIAHGRNSVTMETGTLKVRAWFLLSRPKNMMEKMLTIQEKFNIVPSVALTSTYIRKYFSSIWNYFVIYQRSYLCHWLDSKILNTTYLVSLSSNTLTYVKMSVNIHVRNTRISQL